MIRPGETAPDFTAATDAGDELTLSSLRGSKVVLYFYPKDNTPGCTQEACDFRDASSVLADKNAVVIGVSTDSVKSHQTSRGSTPSPSRSWQTLTRASLPRTACGRRRRTTGAPIWAPSARRS